METTSNHTQRQLPGMLGECRQCASVDAHMIEACRNARQALSLCVRLSGFTDEHVAEMVGISKGYMSKVLNGRASLDGDRRLRLMDVCGNRAPAQYEAYRLGCELQDIGKDAQIRALRQQLAMLEAA